MLTQATLFEKELLKLIQQEIDRHKDLLAVNNYDTVQQFKFHMGQIAAYESIVELADEARKKADQFNR
jgi:hypothetical protein